MTTGSSHYVRQAGCLFKCIMAKKKKSPVVCLHFTEGSGNAEVERRRKAGHWCFLCAGTRGRSGSMFFPSEEIVFIWDPASPLPVAIATVGSGGQSGTEKSVFLCLTEGVRCGRQRGLPTGLSSS